MLDGFPLGTGGPGGPSDPAALMGLESSLGLCAVPGRRADRASTLSLSRCLLSTLCAPGPAGGPRARQRALGLGCRDTGHRDPVLKAQGPWVTSGLCLQPAEGWMPAGPHGSWRVGACPAWMQQPVGVRGPSQKGPPPCQPQPLWTATGPGVGRPQDWASSPRTAAVAPGLGARVGGSCKEGLPQGRPEPRTRPAGLLNTWPLQSRRAGNLTSGRGALRRRPAAPSADLGTAAAQSPPQGRAVWPVPLSDVLAQPWSEGATFCTGMPPLPWARPAQPREPAGLRGACSGGPCTT